MSWPARPTRWGGALALCLAFVAKAGAMAETSPAAPLWSEERAAPELRPKPSPRALREAAGKGEGRRGGAFAGDAALGEWACRISYGRASAGYARSFTMILEADGSWLLQGAGRDAGPFLVLGKWFRAPKGQIFGSGRETRVGDRSLGGLFALELREREGLLISEEPPRAACRRP